MGYGTDSDSQSRTTKSGINTQNILIKDEAEQLKRTGKTAQETIAAIKTGITTDNAEAQSGKLTNNFDKDKVQKELDLQREVTESFGQTVTQTSAMIADKLSEESRKKKYEAAVELENAKKAREENDSETNRTWEKQAKANFDTANLEAKEWETGGSQRRVIDSALNVVGTFLAGRPAAEVVASGLSPTINHQIKEMTTDKDGNTNTSVNLMAHAIWGGIEAYAGNRNVAAGVAGAVTGEAAAGIISQILYDKSPDKLSQEEKLTVSTLSQAAASIAGSTLANNSDGAIIAAKTAKDAVENNFLSKLSQDRRDALEKKIKEGKATHEEIIEFISLEKDDHTSDYLVDKARSRPEKMTDNEWNRLGDYLQRYVSESLRGGETADEINRSVKEIKSGNYIKGYGYAYALDDKYRNDLPSRWTTEGKSAEEKLYENLTAKYVTNPNTIENSFDGRVASSTKEGLELSASVYGVGKALQGAKAINGVMSNSTKFTLGVAGAGSVAGQWSTNGYVDSRTLAIDLVTAYALKGRGFIPTVGGNAASGAFNSYVTEQSISQGAIGSGVGAAIGYGLGKTIEIPLGKKYPDLTWTKYNPQPLNDKVPYVYGYKKTIVPSVSGSFGGEIINRGVQYIYNKSNEETK